MTKDFAIKEATRRAKLLERSYMVWNVLGTDQHIIIHDDGDRYMPHTYKIVARVTYTPLKWETFE